MTYMEVFNLADLSRSFATRSRGREVAGLVGNAIARTKSEAIVVGWNGVSAASPSFIDEFVNEIQKVTETDPRCRRIFFTGNHSGIIDLVEAILKRRESPIRFAVASDI